MTQKLATAVKMTANLRNQKNVYLRWVDTRPSGPAQRFISGISLIGLPVLDLNGWTTTSRDVTGLSADTTYFVRVQAWGEGGWSDWSAVKSVRTSGGSSEPASDFENWLAEKSSSGHGAGETAANGQTYYENYIADIDPKTTNTLEIVPDATGSRFTVPAASPRRYYQFVYSTNLAGGFVTNYLGAGSTNPIAAPDASDWYGSIRVLLDKPLE